MSPVLRPRPVAIAAVAVAVALVSSIGACGGGGASSEAKGGGTSSGSSTVAEGADGTTAAAVIELAGTRFEPADAKIAVGETVRWEWGGGIQHDVAGGSFRSKVQSKGHYEHTFTTAGTFPFHCNVHPGMKGTVTVEP